MWYLAIPLGWVILRTYQGKSIVPDFIADRFKGSQSSQQLPVTTVTPPMAVVARSPSAQLKSMIQTYQTASLGLDNPLMPDDMKSALQSQLLAMRNSILQRASLEGVTVRV